MKRILVALDQNEESLSIVRYVADAARGRADVEIGLFHVLREFMPIHPEFDLGVLPEVQARFEESTREAMDKIFGEAKRILVGAGLTEANIKTRIEPAALDVAQELLAEAEEGGYDTIVLGRRGMGRVRQFFIGSVSNKVVQHAKGRTVWIVE